MSTPTSATPAGTPIWLDLQTPNTAQARDFYQALFGWEYDVGGPEFGGYITARLGDRSAAGIVGEHPDAPPTGAWSLYFASDDIDAHVERAVAAGASLLYPPMAVADMGSMAGLQDPTGAAFSLWQAGLHLGFGVTGEPGAPAWFELYSPDAKAARDFYCGLFGATAEAMEGGLEYYTLYRDGAQLCGIMQIDPSWGPMPAEWVTYFAVADADASVAAARAHGAQQYGGIDDTPFGRLAALRDPSGAMFKLIQLPGA
jgi:uncharacterized protein